MPSQSPASRPPELKGISSMATRELLGELLALYAASGGCAVQLESVGGVVAAQRVQAGEAFDVVFLASDAIDTLITAGQLDAASKVNLAECGVAVAVRAAATPPDISNPEALRRAVLAARSLSYSTGPSGVALARLFEAWGIADQIAPRIVMAPPGVPVGSLVAQGTVELGFQQLSELIHVDGITVVGELPADIQITTTFSGAVSSASAHKSQARSLLAFLASGETVAAICRQGMQATSH